MRIAAAICWYDEPIEHLECVVASVAPLVDSIVAFDGRWRDFPPDRYWVPQGEDMRSIIASHGFVTAPAMGDPDQVWHSQAEKRTALYRAASTGADWILVIDADEVLLVDDVSSLRLQLSRIDRRLSPDAIRVRVATPGVGKGGHGTATAPGGVRWQPRLIKADESLTVGPHSHRTITTDDAVILMENADDRAMHVSRRAGRIATIHGASIVNRTHSRSADRIAAKQAYGKARAERGID